MGVVGEAVTLGKPTSWRADDPRLWKVYQDTVDLKLKAADGISLHTYPFYDADRFVGVLQFLSGGSHEYEAFNPDDPKHEKALTLLFGLLTKQIDLLFPPEKLE